jgi:DNA-binding GntR family transcriptional regulator
LRQLEADGLVNLIPYRGGYVAGMSTNELNDIGQLREALEVFCLEKGINAYSNEDIEEFKALTELSKKKLEGEEKIEAFKTHLSIHYLIIKKSKNKLIEETYAKIYNKMRRYLLLAMKLKPETINIYNADHYKILGFIEARNMSSAIEELRKHLSHVTGTFLGDDILDILLQR